MKQLALTLNLKDDPEVIRQYKAYHEAAWPEVVSALQEVGVLQMKIWILGRRLFMLAEVEDGFNPEVDFPRYLSLHPKCQEWEDIMTDFQEPVADAKPGEKWAIMEEIFKLS